MVLFIFLNDFEMSVKKYHSHHTVPLFYRYKHKELHLFTIKILDWLKARGIYKIVFLFSKVTKNNSTWQPQTMIGKRGIKKTFSESKKKKKKSNQRSMQ